MPIIYKQFCTPICDECGLEEDPEGYVEWYEHEDGFMTQPNPLLNGPFWHRERGTGRILCESCVLYDNCEICTPEVAE